MFTNHQYSVVGIFLPIFKEKRDKLNDTKRIS
nr:MAG TPA: hypothetical protein [Caudoviricetes sp.]